MRKHNAYASARAGVNMFVEVCVCGYVTELVVDGRQLPVTEVDTHGRLYGLKLSVAVDTSDRNERARSSATMRLRRCSVYRVATTLLPEPRGCAAEPLTPFIDRTHPSFVYFHEIRIFLLLLYFLKL